MYLLVKKEDDSILIQITDNGIGLSKSNLETIFELFVQHGRVEEKAHEGLGIGLSLVRNLTELHGGEISVESSGINMGSTFSLKFKLVESILNNEHNPINQIDYKTTNNYVEIKKILVIDDNEDAASTLADLLNLYGHEVQTAFSGKKGIESAKIFSPQIIFLDIGLPDMLGYEVAKVLRLNDETKNCYLIALTGYGSENDQLFAKNAGFDLHLTKPLDYEKLQTLNLGL